VTERWDVVVIGGGIHGVGVAQAAAAAGHRVLLLEKAALANGTSSRSSKLIHGGLRYLERGELSLVYECLHERELLLRLAPELVELKRFHIPLYRTTRRRPWVIRVGLSLYAVLGGLEPNVRFGSIPRQQWADLDGLQTDGLEEVYYYFDAQTDDAGLTKAVMASAQSLGAELALPARFHSAELTANGCVVHYEFNGKEVECLARVLINAGGPWVNEILRRVSPAQALREIDLIQGAHILVEGRLERGLYYVEAPKDGRAVFVMPTGRWWAPQRFDFEVIPIRFRHCGPKSAIWLGSCVTTFPASWSTAGVSFSPPGPGYEFGPRARDMLSTARVKRFSTSGGPAMEARFACSRSTAAS
jgi:glycerol-3-phosphate dehydrogenase